MGEGREDTGIALCLPLLFWQTFWSVPKVEIKLGVQKTERVEAGATVCRPLKSKR